MKEDVRIRDWTEVPVGTIKGAEQRLWGEVGRESYRFAAKINNDPAFLKKVGCFIRNELDPVCGPPIYKLDARIVIFAVHQSLEGEEWIHRLESSGKMVSDSAKLALMSYEYKNQRILDSGYYKVAFIRGMAGKTADQVRQSFGSHFSNTLPETPAEIACSLFSVMPQEQWCAWGINTVIILHEGFPGFHLAPLNQKFLSILAQDNMLITYDGRKDSPITTDNEVAFAILTSTGNLVKDVL